MWIQIIDDGGLGLVTSLYTGTSASQDIVTGQNQSSDGALNHIKNRLVGNSHYLCDAVRGADKFIFSDTNDAEVSSSGGLTAFNNNGFTLGTDPTLNDSGNSYVAWSTPIRSGKFDIVQGSGDGTSSQAYNHNLGAGSTVGMIEAKRTDSAGNWRVYHKDLGNTKALRLNGTDAEATSSTYWNNTDPTSTQFTVGSDLNDSGTDNFIFYVYAHNPSEGIACGSFTTDSSGNATVSGIGFEADLVDLKRSDSTGDWLRLDSVRGFDKELKLNTTDIEATVSYLTVGADGFTITGLDASATYIYKLEKGE